MLESFPDNPHFDLPEFGAEGVLPPGDYAPDRASFETRFVNAGDVVRRHEVYDGWNRHRVRLLEAGLGASARQLLDGSFTTSKAAPADVDLAVEVTLEDTTIACVEPLAPILALLQGPAIKETYQCDAYPIFCLPHDHPDQERVTVAAIRYWTKWFGRTRNGAEKGRVWAKVGGLRWTNYKRKTNGRRKTRSETCQTI